MVVLAKTPKVTLGLKPNIHLPEISGDQEYAGDETNIHGNIQPVGK